MQEYTFAVLFPSLLFLGFSVGIVLVVLGYREMEDLTRRNHLMGAGTAIVGFMVLVTPLSWYGYWMITAELILGLVEIAIIAIAVIIGVILIYIGARIYTRSQ
ncbi:MAG: hypothetical protein ACFFD9_00195 [Candidatus Thorarchaeota archaeon]